MLINFVGGTCKLLNDVSNRDLVKENYILMKPSERDLLLADHGTKAAIGIRLSILFN